ncbi:zinc finger protein CONSTANS-LIKE 4-like [Cornus florida]|uniref:zinc finger protein CONSTANS-LIKE 4-like n=1 Tax=Cornus florida TaxID=4283 RepID=UPI00289661A7|nr:zinc finger protein CONSTANS-LIKE 4-like [Cornus florida]
MGIEEAGGKSFPAGWNMATKPCDSCKLAVALLFCRADSAFMCMDCDSKIHGANRLASRHERVWMCEVCEQAPAAVTCKADAAALCVTCDRDIHSANPLARRHERVPVVPFYDTAEAVVKSTAAAAFLLPATEDWTTVADDNPNVHSGLADAEAPASWMDLPNPNPKILTDVPDMKSIELLFSDSDQFLNLDYPIPFNTQFHQEQRNSGADSVVPVQTVKAPLPEKMMKYSPDNCFEIDFTQSKMSSSSMDVGVVPEGSSMSDMSYSFGQNMSSSMDLGGSAMSQVSQPSGLDREARVLRYREKRKNRKFEKTIRYASRKAYAETRPRIKGRFAKRTEVDSEVDQMLFSSGSSGFMVEAGYGVVPSF